MDTQITNVVQAFKTDKQYTIPSFQRNYVWTRDGQWEPLWEDVSALASRIDAGEEVLPHFLGTIITKDIGSRRFISRWWVVDGQQRLTTLQILLAATRSVFSERDLRNFARVLDGCLSHDPDVVETDEDKYKIAPKKAEEGDYVAFSSIMDACLSEDNPPVLESRLIACYAFFQHAVREWLDSRPTASVTASATALTQAIRQKLRVVDIRLGSDDNAHTIFEALNARGKPLTEWEKTKNYLLSIATRRDDPDGDRTYKEHLATYDSEDYWAGDASDRGKHIDHFLFYFAQIELPGRRRTISGDSGFHALRRNRIYRDFRYVGEHLYRRDQGELQKMLGRFDRFAGIYRDIDEGRRATSGGFSDYALKVMGRRHVLSLSSLVPVFMILIDRLGRGSELDRVLRIVDSYLMRRVALKGRYRDFDSVAFSLVQALRDAEVEDVTSVVLLRLMPIRGWNWWPQDDEVTRHFRTGDMYHQISSERLTLLLAGIAERMHNENRTSSGGSFTLGKVTIEHVAPQHWKPHWAKVFNFDGSDQDESRINGLVHRIGNLTVVSYNSALSNSPWSSKKKLLKRDNLELNQRLLRDREGEVWNEAEIDRRSMQLANYVNTIWPHAEVLAKELDIELPKASPSPRLSSPSESDDQRPLTDRQRNSRRYRQFWTHYAQRYPDGGVRAGHGSSNAWIRRGSQNPDISLAFTRGSVGIFLTRWQRVPQDYSAWVAERQAITDEVLGPGARLHRWKGFDTHNADNWSAMCDWLHEKLVVLLQILEAQPDGTPPLTPPPQSPATPPARTAEVP